MRWPYLEYVLKGLFLGLVVYAALQVGIEPAAGDSFTPLLRFNLPLLLGLVLALGVAAVSKMRQGYQIKGRALFFFILLLLESHTLVYLGVIGGAIVGACLVLQWHTTDLLWQVLGGGALLGVIFVLQRLIRARLIRLSVILVVASALATGLFLLLIYAPDSGLRLELQEPQLFALQLLLGIPFFYALTFAGREEESEVEIGAMCAALGVSLSLLTYQQPGFKSLGVILPVFLYLGYTMRILPALRVFKHVLRGLSHVRIGRHRQALQAFRRALQLDPNNKLAREGFWDLHRTLDLEQLGRDPQLQALVDFDLCLERAGTLLLEGKPTEPQMKEAQALLGLVLNQRPEKKPAVAYWQAVAFTHLGQYEQASAELARVLDPGVFGRHNPERSRILLPAWQLALLLHEELRRRVGAPQLLLPGRRMEAIAVVEQHLANNPDDQTIWGLKRVLYHELHEEEYLAEAETWPTEPPTEPQPPRFDYAFVQQLGLALINNDERWERGGEYLRIAAHGMPLFGPSMFVMIGQAQQRTGNAAGALHNYELAKRAGKSVGPANLPPEEAEVYYGTVKYLGDAAQARGDLDAAIENYRIYVESPSSGIETLRNLAGLCERKGDVLSALRFNDMALVYNAKDKDLLDRKDRYYYSLMPDVLQARLENVRAGFDLDYCIRKAQSILDNPQLGDLEWLDVAQHMAQLALVVTPESRRAKLLLARVRLRSGERDAAMTILEDIRTPKPEKFPSTDDEDAWYQASQVLGDLYVEVGRSDLAIPCFQDFRNSHRSGAKTLFKLAQAHEQLGETGRAVKLYKLVTGYEGNPLVPDAYTALQRLGV